MINKDDLIFTIEVPDFITQIKLCEARRPIYYEKEGGKYKVPPSKLKHIGKKYEWKLHKIGSKVKTLFTDIKTGLPIIKNSRVAGKPKFKMIKGNDFYSGFGSPHQRIMVITAIKDNFKKYFKGKEVKDFPIRLEFIIYNELNVKTSKGKHQTADLDNLFYPYVKSGQDLMKTMGIIPDDNLMYIRKSSCEFIESVDKKLVINAYKY